MADSPDELINETLAGRYWVISQLGVGGMGVAYRAWDEQQGLPVVVKIPKRSFLADPKFAERFRREIRLLQGLSHPHVVPIADVGEHQGLPFVVMRFLPGGSLSNRRLRDDKGAPRANPPEMLQLWLPAVAEALDFVHEQGVVHRDVKPANVFFDAFWTAYLGDFGIAKILAESNAFDREETLTGTNIGLGTVEYMAPEQFTPKARLDGRADQYALAVMVYEMVAGDRPFKGENSHVVVEVLTQPAPSLADQRPELPPGLVRAVHRGLSKQPDERFATCREFAAAALAEVPRMADEPGVARLLCPQCYRILKLPIQAAGRTGNCPKCKERMMVAADLGALWLVDEERHGQGQGGNAAAHAEAAHPADTDPLSSFTSLSGVNRLPVTGRRGGRGRRRSSGGLQSAVVVGALALGVMAMITLWPENPGPKRGPGPVVEPKPQTPPPSPRPGRDPLKPVPRPLVKPEPRPQPTPPDPVPPTPLPEPTPVSDSTAIGTGLLGEYFEGPDLEPARRKLTRVDATFHRDFVRDPVGNGVPSSHFSVRWSGWVVPEATDAYQFVGYSDDGVRIFLDSAKVLDEWASRAAGFESRQMVLTKGKRYKIVVEFFDVGKGNANLVLDWVGRRLQREPVPTRCLFPADDIDLIPVSPPPAPAPPTPGPLDNPPKGLGALLNLPDSPEADVVNSVGMKFKLIPAGEFSMGDPDGRPTELPYKVTLTQPFFLGLHEVTNAQWRKVLGSSPSKFPGNDNPVDQVTWADAKQFCERMSRLEAERQAGRTYRLPTSAEWEYACRAGTATKYCFAGDDTLEDYGWILANSAGTTHAVGQRKANPWGLFDMYGNVWEWCSDWKGPYDGAAQVDPRGPDSSEWGQRILRGGCWENDPAKHPVHSAGRLGLSPTKTSHGIGLRVVFSGPEAEGGAVAVASTQPQSVVLAGPDALGKPADPTGGGDSAADDAVDRGLQLPAGAIFLADLSARDVSVHHGLRIGGENGYGGRVSVLGKASPKAISMHPFPGGKAVASFEVPAEYKCFEAMTAVDDRAKGQQLTPLTFKVYADNREIWKSRPLWADGPTGTCRVAVEGIKTITLVVECPGADNAAWAVWCDPHFLNRRSTARPAGTQLSVP